MVSFVEASIFVPSDPAKNFRFMGEHILWTQAIPHCLPLYERNEPRSGNFDEFAMQEFVKENKLKKSKIKS